ncbi:neuropeptide FF receptor 2-like [Asterias rubens]|uniref:neuropeptide FF receptor 2-like n=1 Tax=Asterias rubens TaxID=7604 RepID=UPI0014558EF7|nr:neuropeptide FF receptor 2-like [Asterias rubens]
MASDGLAFALNVTIACFAIFGNGLVIFVMTVRRKQFSSFTNRLIRHQSIIDLISGLVFLAVTVIRQTSLLDNLEGNFSGWILCKLVRSSFFVWGLSVASTYNLVVISLERFLATCYPVKHRNYCSLFKIKVSMCVAWIIGFTYAIRFIILYIITDNKCGFDYSISPTARIVLFIVIILVEYIIPVILISFSYGRILLVLRQKLDNANANQQNGILSKAKRNVIITLLIAGFMFFICCTPMQTLRVLLTIGVVSSSSSELVTILGQAFLGFIMCNMCVNPVVYCFKYEHFRTQLKQLVRKRFGRNRVRPGEESTDGTSLAIDPIQNTVSTQGI